MQHIKLSTSRDFRIDGKVLQAALEEQELSSDEVFVKPVHVVCNVIWNLWPRFCAKKMYCITSHYLTFDQIRGIFHKVLRPTHVDFTNKPF